MGIDPDNSGLHARQNAGILKYEDQLMSCLMLLPVVLLVFGLAGSLVVLWKRNMEIGGKGCKYLACRFAS